MFRAVVRNQVLMRLGVFHLRRSHLPRPAQDMPLVCPDAVVRACCFPFDYCGEHGVEVSEEPCRQKGPRVSEKPRPAGPTTGPTGATTGGDAAGAAGAGLGEEREKGHGDAGKSAKAEQDLWSDLACRGGGWVLR